ncbi:hypothetical protein JCM8115_000561 [Rhodotorula mucilaginosa]
MTPPPPTTADLKLQQLGRNGMQPHAIRSRGSPAPSPNRMRARRDEEAKAGSRTPLSRSVSPTPTPETESANLMMPTRRSFGRLRRPVRRRTRIWLFLSLLLTAFILELATRSSRNALVDLLYLFHFKLLNRAYEERWTSWLWWPVGLRAVSCALRKEPIVFVRDEQRVAIVWETNTCADDENWELQWRTHATYRGAGGGGATDWRHAESVSVETIQPATSTADARHVHTAHLVDLQSPSAIEYELVLRSRGRVRRSIRHTFPWTYSANEIRPETLHIACFADNQFNVRTFRRILVSSMTTFARRTLPAHYFAPTPGSAPTRRPHLVLHAGDVVQDPDNLAQWQTDFFDPLTRGGLPFPLGQETPVLLARGNHDWDATGQNAYTGGGSGSFDGDDEKKRGTYVAYSPHRRLRILVLDSNLPTEAEQLEQERWLAREFEKDAWREASLKVAVVHTAPWIEWWDRKAWTEGKESQWSAYVRRRLIPQLSLADCALVLSGHSHAYTRGFVPHALVPDLARAPDSRSLSRDTLARLRARPWLHAVSEDDDDDTLVNRKTRINHEPGLVAITFGGAGGSLDLDRVEEWHVMDQSLSGRYHFGWMAVSFGGKNGQEAGGGAVRALDELPEEDVTTTVYHAKRREERCRPGEERVRDVVEWRAVGLDGETELDRFFLIGEGCV